VAFDTIDQFLQYVAGVIAGFINTIQTGLNSAISKVGGSLGSIADSISGVLASLLHDVNTAIASVIASITATIKSVVEPLIDSLAAVVGAVENEVATLLSQIGNLFNSLWEKVQGIVQEVMGSIANFIADVVGGVQALIQSAADSVKGMMDSFTGAIQSAIQGIADWLKSVAAEVIQQFRNAYDTFRAFVVGVVDDITTHLNQAWSALVDGANSMLERIKDALDKVGQSFADVADSVDKGFADLSTDVLKPFSDAITSYLDSIKGVLQPEAYEQLQQAVEQAVAPGTLNLGSSEGFARFFAQMVPRDPLAGAIFITIFGIFIAKGAFEGIVHANSDVLLQQFNLAHPSRLLPEADAVEAYRRDNIGQDAVLDTLRAHGFTPADGVRIIKNSEAALPPGDLGRLLLRGAITDEDFDAQLNVHGLNGPQPGRIRTLLQEIPPLDDIIRMARRLVFSPEVVERYRLEDDYQQVAEDWAKKKGLSPDWSRKYWAAHWDVPSVGQGFEMYQRGFITRDDLEFLMRDAGVAPFWRDKFLQIAYHPFTRVDIRRMHKVGTLTDAELPKAYTDIGYSPENAAKLADFTIKLNAGTKAKKDDTLGALTKTNIVKFYTQGLIDAGRASSMLTAIGVTPEAAALFIANADAEKHLDERKAMADHIVEDAKVGNISQAEAIARLNNLGLTQVELDHHMTALERGARTGQKLPSIGELNRLFKLHQLTEEQFLAAVVSQGFSSDWAAKLLAAEKSTLATPAQS
jgi:hypothetical protein